MWSFEWVEGVSEEGRCGLCIVDGDGAGLMAWRDGKDLLHGRDVYERFPLPGLALWLFPLFYLFSFRLSNEAGIYD
jgi:hypothetical protein